MVKPTVAVPTTYLRNSLLIIIAAIHTSDKLAQAIEGVISGCLLCALGRRHQQHWKPHTLSASPWIPYLVFPHHGPSRRGTHQNPEY